MTGIASLYRIDEPGVLSEAALRGFRNRCHELNVPETDIADLAFMAGRAETVQGSPHARRAFNERIQNFNAGNQ